MEACKMQNNANNPLNNYALCPIIIKKIILCKPRVKLMSKKAPKMWVV